MNRIYNLLESNIVAKIAIFNRILFANAHIDTVSRVEDALTRANICSIYRNSFQLGLYMKNALINRRK